MARIWLVTLMTLSLVCANAATSSAAEADVPDIKGSVYLLKDQPAPFHGVLFELTTSVEIASIIDNYSNMKNIMQLAKDQAEKERRRADRWYRRPSFWIPVACVSFTAGLFVSTWRR